MGTKNKKGYVLIYENPIYSDRLNRFSIIFSSKHIRVYRILAVGESRLFLTWPIKVFLELKKISMRLKSLYHARSFQLFYFGEPKQQNIPLDFSKKPNKTITKGYMFVWDAQEQCLNGLLLSFYCDAKMTSKSLRYYDHHRREFLRSGSNNFDRDRAPTFLS